MRALDRIATASESWDLIWALLGIIMHVGQSLK